MSVWRCWSEPELLKQWFAPSPWSVPEAALDFRPGGESRIVMRSPEGEQFPSRGVYLEIDPGRRLVFTDAFTAGWQPSEKPFFTGHLSFEDVPGGTRYIARALHWSEEDRAAHEAMGFLEGWGRCADQLEKLAQTLG
ncbi:MAG TPA: SRPBCC family protein [Saliniramus sp.]|nr:SRPBCC family protein [Saliniramus sp.]